MKDKCEAIIYWSNENGMFVADAPELPGCTTRGNTQEAALQHISEAIEVWLETAQEFGYSIPGPKGERPMLT